MTKMQKIVFSDVSKSFDNSGFMVLDGLNLQISACESMIILGKSGVGKSVLLKLLLGLLSIDRGEIFVDGINICEWKKLKQAKLKFSVLFQGGALFDSMTVIENVKFGLIQSGVKKDEAHFIAKEKLISVGLEDRVFNLLPADLSGGMQKRVALARAIAVEPEILLFDEPTSGLDPVTGVNIAILIKDTISKMNVTSLTITHDINVAKIIGTRVGMLNNGKIIWDGSPADLGNSGNQIVDEFSNAASGLVNKLS